MSEKLKFDITQMYYRQPFKVNDRITIYQPSVGDIIEFGENDFYNSVLNPFVTNSTSYRVTPGEAGGCCGPRRLPGGFRDFCQQARRRLGPGAGRLLPAGAGRLRQHLL